MDILNPPSDYCSISGTVIETVSAELIGEPFVWDRAHPTKPRVFWAGADHSDPNARPNYDLWLMKYEMKDGLISPGPITRITDNPAADVLPVWSPDGKQLMWTRRTVATSSA